MRPTLDWAPYDEVLSRELPYAERLAAYGAIAEQRLETERFVEFCETHLAHLDEVALEFFGSDRARDAVRQKVTAMFPEHEVERFTEHYWGLLGFWCDTERDRLARGDGGVEGV